MRSLLAFLLTVLAMMVVADPGAARPLLGLGLCVGALLGWALVPLWELRRRG